MLILSHDGTFYPVGADAVPGPLVIEKVVMDQWSVDLSPHYRQAGTFFLMLIPMMMGMVYGFILLDERDGGMITAISVTPTGKAGYLKHEIGNPNGSQLYSHHAVSC